MRTITKRPITKRTITLAAVTTALLLAPSSGAAQAREGATTDARWQALVGCWAPATGRGPQATCVLPAGGTAVEIVTVADGRVTGRERIDASGAALPATREACTGTDRARWSPDGRRLYLRSELSCDGARVVSTGVMAMPSPREWIDARGISVAGGPADVRVRRHVALDDLARLPADLAAEVHAAVAARPTVRLAARANAAARLATESVIEASREVDATVLEAWLVEDGDGFELDARRLTRMADARVPARVIDVVVALTYPERFAIGPRDTARAAGVVGAGGVVSGGPSIGLGLPGRADDYDRYGSQRSRYCDDRYASTRCDAYSPYGVSPYGYSPYGWGRDPWGYGYGYGGGVPPVIVVDPNARQRGRVVKGKGYTRGASEGDVENARPRSTSTSEGSSSGSGDRATTKTREGSSSGSSSGRSAEPKPKSTETKSEGGRKAKPRNP